MHPHTPTPPHPTHPSTLHPPTRCRWTWRMAAPRCGSLAPASLHLSPSLCRAQGGRRRTRAGCWRRCSMRVGGGGWWWVVRTPLTPPTHTHTPFLTPRHPHQRVGLPGRAAPRPGACGGAGAALPAALWPARSLDGRVLWPGGGAPPPRRQCSALCQALSLLHSTLPNARRLPWKPPPHAHLHSPVAVAHPARPLCLLAPPPPPPSPSLPFEPALL